MFTAPFWKAAFERAVRTFAQTAAALVAVDVAVSVIDVDWPYVAGVSATAAVLSILTSIAADKVGAPGPSFGQEAEIKK
jgi:hypothetical protein